MSDNEPKIDVFKAVHAKDGVETVYLVAATGKRDAVTQVLETLGLVSEPRQWTNYYLCKLSGCTINAIPFRPDPPYRLYALNTKTGEMT